MRIHETLFDLKLRFLGSKPRTFYSALRDIESLDFEQLAHLNWMRRLRLVKFCAENIPFYRKKFRAVGFDFRDLKTEHDFEMLPLLEKDEIRFNYSEIVNPSFNINRLRAATTGGTTGTPLKTYNDPRVHLSSISWRMLKWWGLAPTDNSCYLYRAIPQGFRKMMLDIALWPTKRRYISAADMTSQNMELLYRNLLSVKPKYLVGYVGALDAFARFLSKNSYSLPGLIAVWSTSSPLTEGSRIFFERIFRCPVYTQYGSCEFYWIAAECALQDGMHIGSDIRHIDIVEGNKPVDKGQIGDIVVTDLVNYAFPLLRYRIGDRGRLLNRACCCGLPYPMMDYVKGRVSDAIHMPDETVIPGEYWTTIFDDFSNEVQRFQVWQYADYSLEIRYEPMFQANSSMAIEIVEKRLSKKLADRIPVRFKQCVISGNEDGKMRFVVSEVIDSK